MEEDKEQQEILDLANKLNYIIKSKINHFEKDEWEEKWNTFKIVISKKLDREKNTIKEFENDNFIVNKAISEGYVLALEELLTEMGYYEE